MSFNPQHYINKDTSYTSEPITFNIIYIDDISKSNLTKIEEWEFYKDPNKMAVDRLNNSKIITEIDVNEDESNSRNSTKKSGPPAVYKLTLKDNADNYCFAYEYHDKLKFLRTNNQLTPVPIRLGGKLTVQRGTLIINGVLMLKEAQCNYSAPDELSTMVKQLNSNIIDKSITLLNGQ